MYDLNAHEEQLSRKPALQKKHVGGYRFMPIFYYFCDCRASSKTGRIRAYENEYTPSDPCFFAHRFRVFCIQRKGWSRRRTAVIRVSIPLRDRTPSSASLQLVPPILPSVFMRSIPTQPATVTLLPVLMHWLTTEPVAATRPPVFMR